MRAFVRSKKLGKAYIAPVDVVLGDDLAAPDVVFVSNERKAIMGKERITGAPDLVVEVLSLSTCARDLRSERVEACGLRRAQAPMLDRVQ